jgi:hypothetical protein
MRFGFNYNNIKLTILNDEYYHSNTHFSFDKLRIKIDNEQTTNFLELDIPKLIHGNFFKLKGVYYMPLIYILDEPITFKKDSIKLYSLFKPMTFYFKDNSMTLDSHNIPISRFLRIYESNNQIIKEICNIVNTQYIHETRDESIEKISNTLNCKQDIEYIKTYLELIFFDDWTKELYEVYYGIEKVNILSLIEIIIDRIYNNNHYEFNDLNYKRLVFVELLLDPLFKAINRFVQRIKNNIPTNQIPIKANAIISHFYLSKNIGIGNQKKNSGLCGNTVYSIVNGYSGILGSKASFRNPKSQSDIPKSVNSIHESHLNKICPVTISNKKPGVLANLVPDQKIDLRYGIFKD